jgi:hypothetical protein
MLGLAEAEGLGDFEAEGDLLALGLTEVDGDLLALGLIEGEGLGDLEAEGDTDGLGLGEIDALGDFEADGDTEGEPVKEPPPKSSILAVVSARRTPREPPFGLSVLITDMMTLPFW